MSQSLDVLFYVQHLLGIGHLTRAATIVRALRRSGLTVTMVSGGEPVPGLDIADAGFVQLPPVRTDGIEFRRLLDQAGAPIDERFKSERRKRLLALLDETLPRILLIEMFPFGRRQMRFELLPLIEAARRRRSRPLIISSVRDILVEAPKSSRVDDMVDISRSLFDAVLVHGHPAVIPFERTFPRAASIEDLITHTGYVVDERVQAAGQPSSSGESVIVSTGGGRVCEPLLDAVYGAKGQSQLSHLAWRMLIGSNLPVDRFKYWQRRAGKDFIVQRARPDFTQLISNCRLSISQAGYNTVMEVLRAGCPRIVVPYTGGLETEQTVRSRLLAERNFLTVVEPQKLTSEKIIKAIERTLSMPAAPFPDSYAAGAWNTSNILKICIKSQK